MLLETSLAAFERIKNFQKKPFTKIFDKHFCVYIKMSIFPNVLLAFNFFKIAQPTRKAYRGRRHLLATPKGVCGCLGVWSVSHLAEKYSKFIRHNICL